MPGAGGLSDRPRGRSTGTSNPPDLSGTVSRGRIVIESAGPSDQPVASNPYSDAISLASSDLNGDAPDEQRIIKPEQEPEPWWQTNQRVLLGAAAAVAIVLAGVAGVLLLNRGGDSYDLEAGVTSASEVLGNITVAASDVDRFEELQDLNERATEAQGVLSGELDGAAELSDEETRSAAQGFLGASEMVATHFATIGGMRQRDLLTWEETAPSVEAAIGDLEAAQENLVTKESDLMNVLPEPDMARNAFEEVDGYLGDAAVTFAAWQDDVAIAREELENQKGGLYAYSTAVQGLMARYDGLRTELANFTAELDERPVSLAEASSVLENATSARESIRNELQAISPPGDMGAAHANLLEVLSDAVSAVEAATEGLREYDYDSGYGDDYDSEYGDNYDPDEDYDYFDVRDTPGWQTFSEKSDRITTAVEQARQAWNTQVDRIRGEVESTALPERPSL